MAEVMLEASSGSASYAAPRLSCVGLTKRFGGTLAVSDVSFDVRPGEIVALLGQNGAGKSTVIKMMAGVYKPDSGEMLMNGAPHDPRLDRSSISFIHQDLGLIEWMTVAENIALAQGYPRRMGMVDWREVDAMARRSLAMVAHDIDPRSRISDLTRTEKSLVAIARALGVRAQVLVLDEPTASLPQSEVELLFRVLRRLRADGVSMIYVSHRLDEVFAISDSLVVLRDGKLVDARPTSQADPESLIASIIGRRPESVFVRPPAPKPTPLLTCEGVCIGDVGPVSFTLHAGEILALIGLRGAGQESVGRALLGIEEATAGRIELKGRAVDNATPTRAIASGLGFVAADRVAESVGTGLCVRENMFINPGASGRSLFSLRTRADEAAEGVQLGRSVGLSPNAPEAAIETLSGGNQQKVVMARWMRIGADVLVLEDPTAGVDVGAKAEIYRLLADTLAQGRGVLVISTDVEEVAAICHRALVFRGGEILAEIPAAELSVEALTRASTLTTRDSMPAAAPAPANPFPAHHP
jgi:ribose transport system ATP-binding protein